MKSFRHGRPGPAGRGAARPVRAGCGRRRPPAPPPGPITRRYSPAEIWPRRRQGGIPPAGPLLPLGPIAERFAGNGGTAPQTPRGPGRAGAQRGRGDGTKLPPAHALAKGPRSPAPSLFPRLPDRGLQAPGPH